MESFTHESDDSSSCTQSDGDSTNSSNGTNPFLLCPRGNSSLHLQLGGQGRAHDNTEDARPFKLARMEPPRHHQYHSSAIATPLGASSLQYPHNMVGAIHGADGLHSSALLSQNRSYASTALEDCRIPAAQAASAARSHHGSLPYLGPWAELRQQTYVLKHVAACNTPPSALLLPMGCKVENVPVNFGSNAGSYFLGLADPQPGRCRRTDGKKWRCGRAVVPDQKYCERHMHRGRGRSKAARLAKVNAPVDGNQPLNSARPLNQPLIQLLNQLAVPVQPLNQPPEPVQKPPIPAQPLQWLGNPAQQPFLQPHAHLPLLAQPLHAEPLSHAPNSSKPLDWPLNQTPMEAEPLDIVHAYGVPPTLAQAIPINTVSEVKNTRNPANGSRMPEGRRAQADDSDDVFTLDVQGIKRLLENAPCSMRFKKLANQQKQMPNLADLLNVAHFRSPISQPKRPPSLMDVLKMVDPGTATTTTNTTSTSVINHQLQCSTKDNGALPVNCDLAGSDLSAREHGGAPLSLVCSEEQAAEEQSRKYSSSTAILSGSLNLVGARQENDTTALKSFKVKREKEEGDEGVDQSMAEYVEHKGSCLLPMTRFNIAKTRGPSTSLVEGCKSHSVNVSSGGRSEPPSLVKESPDCFGSSAISEKATSNSLDNSKNTLTFIDAHLAKTDENIPNLVKESLKGHKHTVKLDINSLNPEGEEHDHRISLKESQKNSMRLRESSSKHHESSSELERGSLNLLKRTLDHCETPVRQEKSVASLSEKSQEEYNPSASPRLNHAVSVRISTDCQENPVSLDMNSRISVEETLDLHGGSGELNKNSIGSESPTRVLQIKATFARSPSDKSCNVSSSSNSTLILEPAALNNTEPLSQVSLAT